MCEILTCSLRRMFLRPIILNKEVASSVKKLGLLPKSSKHENALKKIDIKIARKEARQKLQNVLGIKEIQALNLVSTYQKLFDAPEAVMVKNYSICTENGIDLNRICNHPLILCEPKLKEKINRIKSFPFDLHDTLPFIELTLRRLYQLVQHNHETVERIHDLCQIFKLSVYEACNVLSKKTFLFTKPLTEIEQSLQVFYEFGFTKKEVLNDLWILKYSQQFVRDRLDFIREHEIPFPKTWMVRCPEETLYKHIKKESDNRDILGEKSLIQYLSEKLQCNENIALSIIRRQPQIQNKSIPTMDAMIDLLYKQGYTPLQICRAPKILIHSTETTEQRIKQLDKLGKKPYSLYVLTKRRMDFLRYVEDLLKLKRAENEE